MNAGVWKQDNSWRSIPPSMFSIVEQRCGIIFASGPALRQLIAYRRRTGTFLPSKLRQPPEQDFVRFRRRVNLRDIFWFRQPPLSNGRVLRPQQIFHPPPMEMSDDTGKSVDKKAEISMLDSWTWKVKHAFSGGKHSPSPSSNKELSTEKSDYSLKTKLWNWDTLASQDRSRNDESENRGHEGISVTRSFDYDVEARRPQDDVGLAHALSNPQFESSVRSGV
ncbi:MAG: hypothetical protein M1820_010329 [Bogoriella megaspora]|nr:MAG: hypothetical protein M1820_010329 [Bogoriella megaspora]